MNRRKGILYYKRIFIVLIFTCFLFSGCGYIWNQTSVWLGNSIPDKEFPLIKDGDTLIYISTLHTDSFFVDMIKFYEIGEGDGFTAEYERLTTSMISLNCEDSCYKFGAYITPTEYLVSTYGFGQNESWYYKLFDYDKDYADIERQIESYPLKDLYLCPNLKVDSISGNEIQQLYYSKNYTIVEYELTNGQIFTLSDESLEMLMARE